MGTVSESKLKLYIRLPVRIDEELQIKDLHPDIIKVVLPRQKSRRWCVVQFSTVETLKNAKKEIQKLKINGKKIIVSAYRQGGKRKPKEPKPNKNKEGNPHKTENEDIDEDFNMLAEEFVDDQDSSDYEDEDEDYYEEEEEEEDENEDDDDDDEYDGVDYWDLGFLSDTDSTIDLDVPGPPVGNCTETDNHEEKQKDEPTTILIDKDTTESKGLGDISTVQHRNLENNSET